MRKVVLDTNFLFLPFQFKIHLLRDLNILIEEPYEIVVPSRAIDELERISRKIGKNANAARFALKMVQSNNFTIVKSQGYVDDWILNYAKENKAIVCTNDRKLRLRLKKEKIPVISLKGKSKVGWA